MKLFLDANVLFAAARSKTGASFAIFELQTIYKFALITSQLALIETERNLVEKEDNAVLNNFYLLVKTVDIIRVRDDKGKEFFGKIIEQKDAPILYAALVSKSDYLITLDRKHFFTSKVRNLKLGFKIITPGEFIQILKN